MSETRGVFSLEDVIEQKAEGDYVALDQVWHSPSGGPEGPNTGYFSPSGSNNQMDKTDFTNDTTAAVPGAALSVARFAMGATGNSTHGYFGGGLIHC